MPETVRWRSCPLKDDLPRSLVLVGVYVGLCALVGVAFGGAGYALLSAVLLGASLARYFLPTDFELDEHGVTVRFLRQARKVPWSRVRRVSVQRAGVYLSPFEKASRLDSFRGTFLRFADNSDEVVSFVKSKLAVAP